MDVTRKSVRLGRSKKRLELRIERTGRMSFNCAATRAMQVLCLDIVEFRLDDGVVSMTRTADPVGYRVTVSRYQSWVSAAKVSKELGICRKRIECWSEGGAIRFAVPPSRCN